MGTLIVKFKCSAATTLVASWNKRNTSRPSAIVDMIAESTGEAVIVLSPRSDKIELPHVLEVLFKHISLCLCTHDWGIKVIGA